MKEMFVVDDLVIKFGASFAIGRNSVYSSSESIWIEERKLKGSLCYLGHGMMLLYNDLITMTRLYQQIFEIYEKNLSIKIFSGCLCPSSMINSINHNGT